MRVAVIISDLMLFSRIDATARACGASLIRLDEPSALPAAEPLDLLLVDWSGRGPGWGRELRAWRDRPTGPAGRLVLFGRHTDLEAHVEARDHRLGPMWARSKLVNELPSLVCGSDRGLGRVARKHH